MKPRSLVALALAVLASGCSNLFNFNQDTKPTPVSTGLTTGQWASISSATTLPNTCTDFRWNITEIAGSSVSGTFTAKCMGTMQIAGTAHGTLTSDTTVTWTANATGTTPGVPGTCPISLIGTATFDGTQLRIPYSGTTGLGPISGAEILRKT